MVTLSIGKKVVHKAEGPDHVTISAFARGVTYCFSVRIPQGMGEAYADSFGSTLVFATAQLTEFEDGIARVVLDTRGGSDLPDGPQHDFEVPFTTHEEARSYLKTLGFSTALVIKLRPYTYKTGHKAGLLRLGPKGAPVLMLLPAQETL